MVAGLLDKDDG